MPVPFRLFLAGAMLIILVYGRAAAHDRPNVIVILADDLGYGDVGCYQRLYPGKRDAITPSIDSLAQNGVVFTDFYAQPVCTPARWCLLTGKHLMRSVDLRDIVVLDFDYPEQGLRHEETTIAEVFRQAGYATAVIGKWHLGSGEMVVNMPPTAPFRRQNIFHPSEHGFDYFYGFLGGSIDYCTHEKRGRFFDWFENRTVLYEDDGHGANAHPDHGRYATQLITEKALEKIDQYAAEKQPFLMYLSYPTPHWAQTRVQDSRHVHQLPNEESDSTSPRYRHYLRQFDEMYPGDDDTNWRKRLLAMVKVLDDGVGEVLDRLRERAIGENTIIVFTSDNGGETSYGLDGKQIDYGSDNGPFTRGDKATLYEGGIRVPLLIQWEGHLPRGGVTNQIASIVDLLPTLAHLSGIDNLPPTDGIDLTPNLMEPTTTEDRDFFYASGQFGKVYRQGRWKYLESLVGGKPHPAELYDLEADPGEANDLAAARADKLAELQELHSAQLRQILAQEGRRKSTAESPGKQSH